MYILYIATLRSDFYHMPSLKLQTATVAYHTYLPVSKSAHHVTSPCAGFAPLSGGCGRGRQDGQDRQPSVRH